MFVSVKTVIDLRIKGTFVQNVTENFSFPMKYCFECTSLKTCVLKLSIFIIRNFHIIKDYFFSTSFCLILNIKKCLNYFIFKTV